LRDVDLVALAVQKAIELLTLLRAEAAAALAIPRLQLLDPRFLFLEARAFLRRERAVLDPFRDAVLLARFALVQVLRERRRAEGEAERNDRDDACELHDLPLRSVRRIYTLRPSGARAVKTPPSPRLRRGRLITNMQRRNQFVRRTSSDTCGPTR